MNFNLLEIIILICLIVSLVIKISTINLNRGLLGIIFVLVMFPDVLKLDSFGWDLFIKLSCILFGLIVINYTSNKFISSSEILILCVLLASSLMVSSTDYLSLYLCLELQSLSIFILIARKKNNINKVEASIKYFVLSSISSGLYLLGASLIFTATGSCDIVSLPHDNIILAKSLIVVALLFKLAASPFHFWVPDVYQGCDNKVLLVLGILPKISVFGILVLILPSNKIIVFATILSLIVGCIGAVNQSNMKRLLAYSSILGMGFVLLGFSINTIGGLEASILYLILYLTAFSGIVLVFKNTSGSNELIIELSTFIARNKSLAIVLSLCILSIAGIPPLGGFLAKWLILSASINMNLILTSLLGIVSTMIAGVYYLRLVKITYFEHNKTFLIWKKIILPNNFYTKNSLMSLGIISYLLLFILILPTNILQMLHFVTISLF